jgi:acyl-CoA thioester hydrolase
LRPAYAEFDGQRRKRMVIKILGEREGEIGNSSFTFQVAICEEESDRLVTTGQIVAVVIDPESQKPVRLPEELRSAVREEYEG